MHGYKKISYSINQALIPGSKHIGWEIGVYLFGPLQQKNPVQAPEIIQAVIFGSIIHNNYLKIIFIRVLTNGTQANGNVVSDLPMGNANRNLGPFAVHFLFYPFAKYL
jgi:hypothetical protein